MTATCSSMSWPDAVFLCVACVVAGLLIIAAIAASVYDRKGPTK